MEMILLYAIMFFFSTAIFAGDSKTAEGSKKVAASAEDICPLLVGQQIPAVQLKTHNGRDGSELRCVAKANRAHFLPRRLVPLLQSASGRAAKNRIRHAATGF